MQHSSGSTGLQKGVTLSHGMVLRQCESYARAIALDAERDVVCSWIPLYHDMGLFTTWLLPLVAGVRVAAVDPFEWIAAPASFLRLLSEFRGTLAWQPNFAFNLLSTAVRDSELDGLDLSSVRGLTSCSEPVRASTMRLFHERYRGHGLRREALWTCYAMAESSFAVTCASDALDGLDGELVSCGKAIDGIELKIVDGEIAIRGPFVLRGYVGNPEATAAAVDADGWFRTGDLGLLRDGELFVSGRKKDLLIVAGRNFWPQDIEAVVDACPHAIPGRSVAVGVDDATTGTQRIVVLCETATVLPEEKDALRDAIRARLAGELDCPVSEVHLVPPRWLVKTSSGKIARQPNLARFRDSARPSGARRVGLEHVAWGAALGLAAYVATALAVNASWGVYARF